MSPSSIPLEQSARVSVAPMMDWTDRHCRFFHRLISQHALLYTEMVTSAAIVHGDAERHLTYNETEHPVALQLGGSDPEELREAMRIANDYGYDEVNLNVGCPSDRVQSGCFGAVLMKDPALVARCLDALQSVANCEVTVKCRIGVDDQDPAEALPRFLSAVDQVAIKRVTIHARKAWLKGLSPKENRDVPPLDYPLVREMKARFSHLHVSINGGVSSLDEAQNHLQAGLDGVMIGRAAYSQPFDLLAGADALITGTPAMPKSAEEVALAMLPYIERHLSNGGKLHHITRHMLGLFSGRPGARGWRRLLSTGASKAGAGPELIEAALTSLGSQAA